MSPSPYYDPKSTAPILQEGLQQRLKYLEQPKGGMIAALPALGQVADTAFKQMSIMQAKEVYSNYLNKKSSNQTTPEDDMYGEMAAKTLGLTLNGGLDSELKRSQIDENKSNSRLKNSTARLYETGAGQPSATGEGPETFKDKTGREWLVKRDPKTGFVTYQPLQPLVDTPIAAETATKLSLAKAGMRAIGQIRTIVTNPATKDKFFSPSRLAGGFGGEVLSKMSQDTETQTLYDQIKEAGDAISRLRSGAAITPVEEARYGGLLNGRYKTVQAYNNAITTVEAFLQSVDDDLRTGKRKLQDDSAVRPPATGSPKATPAPATPGGVTADNPLGI